MLAPANYRGCAVSSPVWRYFFGVLPLPAWAARAVRVYEVDVSGQSTTALQDAMRQALVRATGRRESANDPALASLIEDAPKYVKSYSPGPARRDAGHLRQGGGRACHRCCRAECLGPGAPVHVGCALSATESR